MLLQSSLFKQLNKTKRKHEITDTGGKPALLQNCINYNVPVKKVVYWYYNKPTYMDKLKQEYINLTLELFNNFSSRLKLS